MARITRRVLMALWLGILIAPAAQSQELPGAATAAKAPVVYFLDQLPWPLSLPDTPAGGRDMTLVKVRLMGRPTYLVGRDNSGEPAPITTHLFRVRVETLDVRLGSQVAVGARYDVFFGTPGLAQELKYPHTPGEMAIPYFVHMYVGQDGDLRLVGSPLSEADYEKWDKARMQYERARSHRRVRD